jgi:hypothetical protein
LIGFDIIYDKEFHAGAKGADFGLRTRERAFFGSFWGASYLINV